MKSYLYVTNERIRILRGLAGEAKDFDKAEDWDSKIKCFKSHSLLVKVLLLLLQVIQSHELVM